jgi:hypothetical protein
MEQPPNSVLLQTCPSCKQLTLMLNEVSGKYECLNCRDTFFRATIDKYNQQEAAEKKARDQLTEQKPIAWSGNQYYDSKRKKWRNGKKIKRLSLGHKPWLSVLLMFILVSLIITLILNYLYPGSHFIIIGW